MQAADAGTVINPMQCRAQIEGGVAQALGAALFEEMVIDGEGHVTNPTFRTYHIPAYADIPRTEVLFAKTIDPLGPFGAKSMSESPYNPVAAALAQRHSRRHRRAALSPAVQTGPDPRSSVGRGNRLTKYDRVR